MQRRSFLAGSVAFVAQPAWAEMPGVRLLTAANDNQNRSWLIGLDAAAQQVFRLPLPARGHAAAAHPIRAQAVAFARRPGRFASVVECIKGREIARLNCPEARHFYGHGAFTRDGHYLLTTENAFESGQGRLGIWDAHDAYKRVGEIASGGIGPHDILRLPDGSFAVANGGIQTHPDFGRAKLNLPDMRPNLTIMNAVGAILDQVEPPKAMRQNSIRHLSLIGATGVAIALQWQGHPLENVPLLATYKPGQGLRFHDHPQMTRLKQYAGSIAVRGQGEQTLLTGPKGDHALVFNGPDMTPAGVIPLAQASGVALVSGQFAVTCSQGVTLLSKDGPKTVQSGRGLRWDNHLVAL